MAGCAIEKPLKRRGERGARGAAQRRALAGNAALRRWLRAWLAAAVLLLTLAGGPAYAARAAASYK
ncbi:MAG: outer membrane protein assembly factor, partial [Burkholderia sp.]|nr:outer membrane protein assembly factor [Burkholderia sp.]